MDDMVMFPLPPGRESPNKAIDMAIKKLMKSVEGAEPEVCVKVLSLAINWEKTKHQILGSEEVFDPEGI